MADLYTFASFVNELGPALGNRDDLGSRINTWVNEAQSFLATCDIELPRLERIGFGPLSTVAGTPEYSLTAAPFSNPNDIVGIRAVRVTSTSNPLRLRRFAFEEYRSLTTQASGPPNRYARWGNTIVFDPNPDAVYTVIFDYRRYPVLGTIEVENAYQKILMSLSMAIGFERLQQFKEAGAAMALLPQWVSRAWQNPLSQSELEARWDPSGFQPPMAGRY